MASAAPGGMKGAELWVAQLVGGEFSLRALWSEDYTRPQPSAAAQASLALRGWTSTPSGSVWAFSRPVRAAGSSDQTAAAAAERAMSLGAPMGDIMLWALGAEPGEFGYHGASMRGSARVLLSSSHALPDPAAPSDAKVLRIVTPPVITDDKTVSRYCWSWHRLPSDRKYHITRVEPLLVHPELKSLVHHMVTYACPASFEQGGGGADGDTLRAGGVVCRSEGSMPPACPQNFIGWADAGSITYPQEAGFPFGSGETRSILLEMHYENVQRMPGIEDTSGLLFTYTSQLRAHDLGYIIVGDALERQAPQVQRVPQLLPGGRAEYEVANLCPASCTRRMSGEDMHVVSTTMHMHVKGVHEYLELWRDGRRHGRVAQPHWDFLKQDALPGEDLTIHPGDELLTRCVYNTKNSTAMLPPYVTGSEPAGGSRDVVGGFGTYNDRLQQFEEMCCASHCFQRLLQARGSDLRMCTPACRCVRPGVAASAALDMHRPAQHRLAGRGVLRGGRGQPAAASERALAAQRPAHRKVRPVRARPPRQARAPAAAAAARQLLTRSERKVRQSISQKRKESRVKRLGAQAAVAFLAAVLMACTSVPMRVM